MRTQPPEYQPDTRGMPRPLSGTDSVVSGAFEHLLDIGRGRNSVNRVTRSSAEGRTFYGELDAGVAVDRGKRQRNQYMPLIAAEGLKC